MKIPMDLQAGDIFHCEGGFTELHKQMTFRSYDTDPIDKSVWAKTNDYSFLIESGSAYPTDITVVRIQRVNSSGMTDEAKYNEECMKRQERCTKGRIAAELQSLLAQNYYEPHDFKEVVEEYKDKLFKEAEPT